MIEKAGRGARLCARRIKAEQGQAMAIALAFMVLAVPLVVGALSLASTLTLDAREKHNSLLGEYSALGAQEIALRLLIKKLEETTTTIFLNGGANTTIVAKLIEIPAREIPFTARTKGKPVTSKVASPASLSFSATTTYTLTVENLHDEPVTINQTFDDLPTNFTYVAGTSKLKTSTNPFTGIDDPRITSATVETNTFTELRWDDTVTLGAQEKMFIEFKAIAPASGAGLYCNEVYVKPGHRETRSGKTAKINVGSSTSTLCFGPTTTLEKTGTPELIFANTTTTYTYVIKIVNEGTEILKIDRIEDYAPELFSYDTSTAVSSTPTSLNPGEPKIAIVDKGGVTSTRLRWQQTGQNFWEIPVGTTWFIEYQGTATFPRGHFPSEVEIRFDEKQLPIQLSGPAAIITSLSIFRITVTAFTGYVYECDVWFANDVYIGDFEVVDGCSQI